MAWRKNSLNKKNVKKVSFSSKHGTLQTKLKIKIDIIFFCMSQKISRISVWDMIFLQKGKLKLSSLTKVNIFKIEFLNSTFYILY